VVHARGDDTEHRPHAAASRRDAAAGAVTPLAEAPACGSASRRWGSSSIPRHHARVRGIFAASGDLGNFTGFRQGSPDYERAINIVHDAAFKAGVRLCGPLAWRDRPDFTCFQAGSETLAIARGVAAELGPLANTQGKPDAGPFAAR
jgi:hypothetical protein